MKKEEVQHEFNKMYMVLTALYIIGLGLYWYRIVDVRKEYELLLKEKDIEISNALYERDSCRRLWRGE